MEADAAFLTAPVLLCHKTAASMLGKLCGIFLRICRCHEGAQRRTLALIVRVVENGGKGRARNKNETT